MPVVGALAAALALLTTQVDGGMARWPPHEQARMFAARIVVLPVTQSHLAEVAEAISPHESGAANGPPHDGMSLREMRPHDLSGQTTLPLVVGRF